MFFVYRYPQGKKSSLKSHVLMFFCLKKSCRSSGFEQTKHLLDLQNLHEPKKSSLKSHVLLFFCLIIRVKNKDIRTKGQDLFQEQKHTYVLCLPLSPIHRAKNHP